MLPARIIGSVATDLTPRIALIRERYNLCFGCGLANPIGLHLDGFRREGSTVTAQFVSRDAYRGFADAMHGGVVAAALDEIMAWTAILVADTMAVTARMELRFRKPAPPDGRYELVGTLVERRGKRLVMEASCRYDGVAVAEASALFLATEAL